MTKLHNVIRQIPSSLISIVLFLSLSSFIGNSFSPKRKMAFQIIRQVTDKYEKKYGLRFSGISEAASTGKYENLGFDLDLERTLTTLNAFNKNPSFHQYIKTYPFTGKNILININSYSKNNQVINYPDIKIFSFYNDTLWFKADIPETQKQYGFYYSEEKETLDEARAIVEAQKQAI